LVDHASEEGDQAGAEAAKYAMNAAQCYDYVGAAIGRPQHQRHHGRSMTAHTDSAQDDKIISVLPTEGIRYIVPQYIDPNTAPTQNITLSFRVIRAVKRPRFFVEGIDAQGNVHPIKKMRTMVAIPAEMVQIKLTAGDVLAYTAIRVHIESEQS
jgi:hypothetical protein